LLCGDVTSDAFSVQKVFSNLHGGYGREGLADAASNCLDIFVVWSRKIDFMIRANRRKCQNWAAMFGAKIQNASVAMYLSRVIGQ
jgi:hypothetical protein